MALSSVSKPAPLVLAVSAFHCMRDELCLLERCDEPLDKPISGIFVRMAQNNIDVTAAFFASPVTPDNGQLEARLNFLSLSKNGGSNGFHLMAWNGLEELVIILDSDLLNTAEAVPAVFN
ncbi:hypothetical protein BJF96_g9584 [Verticillium dahliae]|uniref:Uncharacterized protein n=1 Tax=Verticillium dahliae TaxID=27337 RepID=A0AA44W932_VERDA|nr:hypothetical protein BJF96_g9584 [Verticillium dahliae]